MEFELDLFVVWMMGKWSKRERESNGRGNKSISIIRRSLSGRFGELARLLRSRIASYGIYSII